MTNQVRVGKEPMTTYNAVETAIDRAKTSPTETWKTIIRKGKSTAAAAAASAAIEVHDNSTSLLDLKGIAPNATGELRARDFVDSLRDDT